MRKLYQSEKWKRHSKRRSKFELNAARARKVRRRARVFRQNYNIEKKPPLVLELPKNFSVFDNLKQMLPFFEDIKKHAFKGRRLFLDMAEVENITPEAIVSTLVIFDYCEKNYGYRYFSGNMPKDQKVQKLFRESGFFNYVKGPGSPPSSKATHILQIKIGNAVDGEVAKEVIDFAMAKLQKPELRLSQSLYRIIIECMANTLNHAYSKENLSPHWYLMALFDDKARKVRFVFADGGLGIPRTLKKRNREIIRKLLNDMMLKIVDDLKDSHLIHSALNGDFRTQTNKIYRGRGLPSIYAIAKKATIENVRILSSKGFVNCSNDLVEELEAKYTGTLLSWDFVC